MFNIVLNIVQHIFINKQFQTLLRVRKDENKVYDYMRWCNVKGNQLLGWQRHKGLFSMPISFTYSLGINILRLFSIVNTFCEWEVSNKSHLCMNGRPTKLSTYFMKYFMDGVLTTDDIKQWCSFTRILTNVVQ